MKLTYFDPKASLPHSSYIFYDAGDRKALFEAIGKITAEYGVIQNVYNLTEADYNSNRRASKAKKMMRQLPGVSHFGVFPIFAGESGIFITC